MSGEYKCPNCGGQREYNPKQKALVCVQCDSDFEIEVTEEQAPHPFSEYKVNELPGEMETTLSCSSCGAVIEMDEHTTATSCPYCASKIVLSDKQTAKIPIDAIQPFCISKADVPKIFHNWLAKKWLAPNALKRLYQQGKILGIYLPFWLFDTDVDCDYKGEGGRHRTEYYTDSEGKRKSRTVTDWFPVSGRFSYRFKNFITRATQTIKDHVQLTKMKFDFDSLLGYNGDYLAGFSSEIFTIPMEQAWEEAKMNMYSVLENEARKEILRRYDEARVQAVYPYYHNEAYRHILMPAYSTAYQFKGKVYGVMINGETGEVAGKYPKSYVKIAGLVILAILIILAIVYRQDIAAFFQR